MFYFHTKKLIFDIMIHTSPTMSWSPSPYPYPSGTPSSPPYSFTGIPMSSVSVQATVQSQPTVQSHPNHISSQVSILSHVSDDAFYGIICAIGVVVIYSISCWNYYYRAYKKEKLRVKRFNEVQWKTHSSVRGVIAPFYPV